MNTKEIGDRSVGAIIAQMLKSGITVLTPFGDRLRYDLVIEKDGAFNRVQCKTGRLKNGKIVFNAYSMGVRYPRSYTKDEIDSFGIYVPELDKVYMVPVGVTKWGQSLRIDPTKNKQKSKIWWADKFELRA